VRRFVNVSTDEVYGESSAVPDAPGTLETGAMFPTNPYAAGKAGAEMVARSYLASYGVPVITTRGNNVYGRMQFPGKLIPKAAMLLRLGRPVPVHGSGRAVRNFVHVDDVADAFDVVLHRGAVGEVYNIGTEEERSVTAVVADVVRAAGAGGAAEVVSVRDRAFNDRRYFINADTLRCLGWRPRVSWEAGMSDTVAWYMDPANTERRSAPGEVELALRAHGDRGEGEEEEEQ
jgi:UDP-glucose 4,6-dehydratase